MAVMNSVQVEHKEGFVPSAEEVALLQYLRSAPGHASNPHGPIVIHHAEPEMTQVRTGNPSSLGISVFAVANTMIALHLMRVRDVHNSNLLVGVLWFTGGVASWLACILEYFQGNTFAYCVFGSFGGYYFAFAATLTPAFGIADGYGTPEEYAQSVGIFFCVWASLFFVFLVVSTRTNAIFVWIFATVDATAWCLAASYFRSGAGDADSAVKLAQAGGGLLLACSMAGWYLLLSILMESVGFPIRLPVGVLVKPVQRAEDPGEEV